MGVMGRASSVLRTVRPIAGAVREADVLTEGGGRIHVLPGDPASVARLRAILGGDLTAPDEDALAIRDGRRLAPRLEPLPAGRGGEGPTPWRNDGVYLLAGDLGESGLPLARAIAARGVGSPWIGALVDQLEGLSRMPMGEPAAGVDQCLRAAETLEQLGDLDNAANATYFACALGRGRSGRTTRRVYLDGDPALVPGDRRRVALHRPRQADADCLGRELRRALRDECLNDTLFSTPAAARSAIPS